MDSSGTPPFQIGHFSILDPDDIAPIQAASAVSTINIRMLLAVNGHLQRQKSSTCDSRPPVSSLYLPIECGASTLDFLCDKALV